MIDAPIYVDWLLATILMFAGGVQYVWLAFHGNSVGRWLQALGFTGISLRLMWSLSQGIDPPIAAVSVPLLMMLAIGCSLTAIQQMRLLWLDVRCIQDPKHVCFREDRVRWAIKERRGWHK
jgi:hypothetical protein